MQLRSALIAATVLATPFAASAQPVTGLYVGFGAGVNVTQQENVNGVSLGLPAIAGVFAPVNGNINGSTGFGGVLNLGWGFGNGLRAEVEGNYRNNHSGGFTNGNFNSFGVGGGSTEAEVRRHGQRAVRLQWPVTLGCPVHRRWCRLRRHQGELACVQ